MASRIYSNPRRRVHRGAAYNALLIASRERRLLQEAAAAGAEDEDVTSGVGRHLNRVSEPTRSYDRFNASEVDRLSARKQRSHKESYKNSGGPTENVVGVLSD